MDFVKSFLDVVISLSMFCLTHESSFSFPSILILCGKGEVSAEEIKWRERRSGKWTSVTVSAPVKSAEMLYELYETIDRDPRVRFKF